ncbi:MAG TPA: SdrD B-like domain-containing protein [Ignavibacteriales bacterium]|nr:SdrD B-like domain-containing protein [Ignavibacteriales bacterium]
MKRLYYFAIAILLCLIALTGYARAQIETLHERTLGGMVFEDLNENGINDHEPGVGGITVILHKYPDGTALSSTTTSYYDGSYSFTCSNDWNPKASYYIEFELLDKTKTLTSYRQGHDKRNDSDVDPETRKTDNYSFQNIEKSIDAGLIPSNFIGNSVWSDSNGDGIQNEEMTGIGHITIELYSYVSENDKQLLGSTETDYKGMYKFSHMQPGTYCLRFVIPHAMTGKYEFTESYGSLYEPKNSDAGREGWTIPFVLTLENMPNFCIDAGLKRKTPPAAAGCIGDFVWLDKNGNGLQDTGEPGVSGLRVELYSCQWNHAVHSLLATATTNSDGYYSFTNLVSGTYCLKFIASQDYQFTARTGSLYDCNNSDAQDDGSTIPIILSDGYMVNNCIDAGMSKGQCLLANLGDLVWNDANRNGIQDGGETGLEGVVLKLHLCTSSHANPNDPCLCGPEIALRTTDKVGRYMFNNIMPGRYCVEIVVPCQFTITKPGQTDDWKDSDIIPAMKHTECILLAPGETNNTVDAGLYPTPPATIGDLVWIDANKNGIQDNGEKGLCNVNVELYMCGVGSPFAAAKTDNDGKYIFRNVVSGTSYAVKFYLPKGYTFAALDQGGNDNFDSDVCARTCGGMTKFYDVYPDEVNLTIDCGMYLATTSTCNYVWNDANSNGIKDKGEQGIQGVTVDLYNCSSNALVQSSKTDAAGLFTFTDILLDSYYLKVTIPDGYQISNSSKSGNPEGVDSDFSTDGKSSCFDITDATKLFGKPIALEVKQTPSGIAYRSGTPAEFSLLQNYPNPFNPSTTIEFAVPEAGQYSLKIYNMLGQEVLTLIDRELPIGYHMAVFDASRMPSGVYIYRLTGKKVMLIKKMMLSR